MSYSIYAYLKPKLYMMFVKLEESVIDKAATCMWVFLFGGTTISLLADAYNLNKIMEMCDHIRLGFQKQFWEYFFREPGIIYGSLQINDYVKKTLNVWQFSCH